MGAILAVVLLLCIYYFSSRGRKSAYREIVDSVKRKIKYRDFCAEITFDPDSKCYIVKYLGKEPIERDPFSGEMVKWHQPAKPEERFTLSEKTEAAALASFYSYVDSQYNESPSPSDDYDKEKNLKYRYDIDF